MKRIDKRKEVKGMFYYCAKCANIENINAKTIKRYVRFAEVT